VVREKYSAELFTQINKRRRAKKKKGEVANYMDKWYMQCLPPKERAQLNTKCIRWNKKFDAMRKRMGFIPHLAPKVNYSYSVQIILYKLYYIAN